MLRIDLINSMNFTINKGVNMTLPLYSSNQSNLMNTFEYKNFLKSETLYLIAEVSGNLPILKFSYFTYQTDNI